MLLTLEITGGPHAGEKIRVRTGQIARIGRTAWADFSLGRDSALADVQFAVDCRAGGAHLRNLADLPVAIDGKPVRDAALKSGDRITAGQSEFLVVFDGAPASAAASPSITASLSSGLAFTGAAAALATASAAPVDDRPTPAEIAERLKLGDEALAWAQPLTDPQQLVAQLTKQKKFAKAIRLQAHLLERRQAVWWGVVCVRETCAPALPPIELAAADMAAEWVADPNESRRRAAEHAAGRTPLSAPGGWLATAVFWSGGSLVPPDMAAVPPDELLLGQAITNALLIASSFADPKQTEKRYTRFLELGVQAAAGGLPPPESLEDAQRQ